MTIPCNFFDLQALEHQELFLPDEPVWTALDRLPAYLASFFKNPWPLAGHSGMVDRPLAIVDGMVKAADISIRTYNGHSLAAFEKDKRLENAAILLPGAYLYDDRVIIGTGTIVEPGALIKGPTVIGADTEVRQGAYIRGDCLIGNRCVVGHVTEIKSSIMLDGAKAGHFAYIGDSIVGRDVNLGAGTKLANLKIIQGPIRIPKGQEHLATGRRKLGAILGDRTETGCNSVTSPGTLMEPGSIVYAGVSVPGGYYSEKSHVRLSPESIKIKNPLRSKY